MDKLSKVKDLKMPRTKRERNYLKGINLMNARVWFRYRCKTTAHIKGKTKYFTVIIFGSDIRFS